MLGTLLTFFAIGLVALVAIGLTLTAVGIVFSLVGGVFSLAFGLAGFLLFKVAPIVFLGWLVLKVLDRRKGRGELSTADREWLESGH